MHYTRRKRYWFVSLSMLLMIRCATDPGTSTPVAGGAITFTQATGQVRVISSVEGTQLTTAVVLFDTHLATGTLGEATLIEEGVTVTWPEALSFEIPGCTVRPTLIESTSYITSKVFRYVYPDTCTPVASSEVAAQAVVIITKNGTAATITDTTSTVGEQAFTASGTWTAPTGVTSVTVECWGGGGGGQGAGGQGGGGGAYSKKLNISVTPGASYSVVVGAAGTPGEGEPSPDNGTDGGDSYFIDNTTVLAKGGRAGTSFAGGAAASGIGDTKFSGGHGEGSGGGSSAGPAASGTNASNHTGGVAPSGGGDGANGSPTGVGADGEAPGGGGAGGGTGESGGDGASGKVILAW